MKTLLFTNLFPSSLDLVRGVFTRQLARDMGRLCELNVMVPAVMLLPNVTVPAVPPNVAVSGVALFHVVSPAALTFRGYAEGVAAWYGVEAHLEFLAYDEWRAGVADRDAAVTLDHLRHSPNCSIAKARSRLNYAPRYSSLAAVQEAVQAMRASTGC